LEKHTRSVIVMKKKREEAEEVFIYAAGSHGIMRSMVCFEKRSREADHAISRYSLSESRTNSCYVREIDLDTA
jgi:hypothetical protein